MDRISNLPDVVIHHILSFLSTIEAAPTSVFSKRWRTLFTQIPTLTFYDRDFVGREQAFAPFVNSVHAIHTATDIRYRLRIRNPVNLNYVKTWVRFAVDRNVRELHVDIIRHGTFEMPRCESVKNLRLNLENGTLKLPATACFASLETLSLSTVNFPNDTYLSVTSQQFPCIKSLSLEGCGGLTRLEVICPILEEIEIVRCQDLWWLDISGEQIQSLSVHDSFTYGMISVRIFAPGLQHFKWLDYVVGDFRIGNFTSLKVAHVSLVVDPEPEHKELYLENATSFLNNLASVGSLEVEMPCFWGLPTQKELLERLSTPPHHLKHLTLLVGLDDNVFQGVSHLFRSCPNLNTVKVRTVNEEIHESIMERFPEIQLSDGGEQWKYEDQPLNQLLEVELCGFKGRGHEIEFVEFLLKNAPVLKRMIMLFSTKASLDQRMKTQLRVMELERSSPNAIVNFC